VRIANTDSADTDSANTDSADTDSADTDSADTDSATSGVFIVTHELCNRSECASVSCHSGVTERE
jgi:hypothetical protein